MFKQQRWRRRHTALVALVGLALIGAAVELLWLWFVAGAGAADPQASVLGVVLAAGIAVVALFGWDRRKRRDLSMPAPTDRVTVAAETLADVVLAQWRQEMRLRALEDPAPMPVRWRLAAARLMDHPEVIAPDGLAFEGSADQVDDLVAAFRGLPRRRLVVIGGPGTGKTTLAVQLLVHLLATRQEREPVPVLFSLIDFDPESSSLADWLAGRLVRDYPGLDAPAARALVERDRLLPVLDGLDEVAADRRTGWGCCG